MVDVKKKRLLDEDDLVAMTFKDIDDVDDTSIDIPTDYEGDITDEEIDEILNS